MPKWLKNLLVAFLFLALVLGLGCLIPTPGVIHAFVISHQYALTAVICFSIVFICSVFVCRKWYVNLFISLLLAFCVVLYRANSPEDKIKNDWECIGETHLYEGVDDKYPGIYDVYAKAIGSKTYYMIRYAGYELVLMNNDSQTFNFKAINPFHSSFSSKYLYLAFDSF